MKKFIIRDTKSIILNTQFILFNNRIHHMWKPVHLLSSYYITFDLWQSS